MINPLQMLLSNSAGAATPWPLIPLWPLTPSIRGAQGKAENSSVVWPCRAYTTRVFRKPRVRASQPDVACHITQRILISEPSSPDVKRHPMTVTCEQHLPGPKPHTSSGRELILVSRVTWHTMSGAGLAARYRGRCCPRPRNTQRMSISEPSFWMLHGTL